jgi:hypothetical protein
MQIQLKSHSLRVQCSQLQDVIQLYRQTQHWTDQGMQTQATMFERLTCDTAALKFFVSSDKQAFFLHLQSCPELVEAKQLMISYFSDLEDWALLLSQQISQCHTFRLKVVAKVLAQAESSDSLGKQLIPVCIRLVGAVTALKQVVIEQLSPAAAWLAAYQKLFPADMDGVAPTLVAMGNKLRLPAVPGVMDQLMKQAQALRAVSLGADVDVNICRISAIAAPTNPASAAAGATVAAAAGPSNLVPSTVDAAAVPAGSSPAAVATSLDSVAAAAMAQPSGASPNIVCTEALSAAAASPDTAVAAATVQPTLSPGAAASGFNPEFAAASVAAVAEWIQECLNAEHPTTAAADSQGLAGQSSPSFV